MNEQSRARVYGFLQRHVLAVIATNSGNNYAPESALVAYAEDEHLCLFFQTGKHTRKAKNLLRDAHVSFVIGHNLDELATMQYEGMAKLLVDEVEISACKQRFLDKKSPTTKEYLERPDAIFYKVMPTWICYSDYSTSSHPTVSVLEDFSS